MAVPDKYVKWPEKPIEWKKPTILDHLRTGIPVGEMVIFAGYRNSGKSLIDYNTKLQMNAEYGRLSHKLSEIVLMYNHEMKVFDTPEQAYDRAMKVVE
jgi:archaellum biogenesis ATPase FlaH